MNSNLFELALNIQQPFFVKNLDFNQENKKITIYIDFTKGSQFEHEVDSQIESCPVYDTTEKMWRHLNFFEHECHLVARIPRIKLSNGKVVLIKVPWEGQGFCVL